MVSTPQKRSIETINGIYYFFNYVTIYLLGWVGSTSEKVMEIFSAGSQLYVGGDFLSQNSQHLGQQVIDPFMDV